MGLTLVLAACLAAMLPGTLIAVKGHTDTAFYVGGTLALAGWFAALVVLFV
jgi:hypothetical protein